MRKYLFALFLIATACDQGKSAMDQNVRVKNVGSGSAGSNGIPPKTAAIDIDSKDILGRAVGDSEEVSVKHVLLAWKELDATMYHGKIDPRAKNRTNEEAAKLAQDTLAKLQANPDAIDELAKTMSEDPGSKAGDPYVVDKDTPFVPEFKNLAMRLKIKEAGIVKTAFGYHVIERVPPAPLDPLESKDILDRKPDDSATMQRVLIGWKEVNRTNDPRAKDRTKEQADKIASDVLAKAKAGEDFTKLMKDFSEDPNSKDTGKTFDVMAGGPSDPSKKLALRLKDGEIGMVKTQAGWQIIKRMPPDPLESKDILARTDVAPKAKVKHVLLGWTDAHAEDPRGVKRTRAELEKLVKETVDKLNKGANIDDVMKELSEDPGSAKLGKAYDVAADSQFVPSFKNLSLRLKVNEVGVVKSSYGMHIIKRIE
ncbi:MAG: peptidylprolyl isomerase [Kofleriaceae bacterium]